MRHLNHSFQSATLVLMAMLVAGCRPSVPPANPLTDAQVTAAIAAAPAEITYRDELLGRDRLGYEATKWITTNANLAPFASNHFESRTQAVEFARSLYRLGATKVYVVHIRDEPARILGEGGPYSDSLFVYLPSDRPHRRAIFAVEAREAKDEGFSPTEDKGQERLFFWWD